MTKDKFEKDFIKGAKDKKVYIVIEEDKDSEFPKIGCQGKSKEMLWSLTFATAQLLMRITKQGKEKDAVDEVAKLIKEIMKDED